MFQSSLTRRLNFLLTICIASMVLVTSGIDYQLSKRVLLDEVASETGAVIADTLNDLETHIAGIERATDLFADILEQRPYAEREIEQMLQVLVRGRNDIFGTTVALDPRMASNRQSFAPYYHHGEHGDIKYINLAVSSTDYPNQAWFREPKRQGKAVWSEPYFDAGGARILMSTYSVPMYINREDQREFYGVVTADLALADLNGQLASFQLGQNGFALLLSQRGKILAGPDHQTLMEPMLNTLPEGQDLQQWGKIVLNAARGTSGTARMPCIDQQGMCVLNVAPLPSTGWSLGTYYSEYEVLAPLRQLLLRMALSELVGLILILIAVAMISRRITRPLYELASITDNVAAGNLDAPMPRVRNQDEVGRLITSFGSMQKSLKQFIARLEQETASRNRLQGEMNAATEIQLAMLPDAGLTHLQQTGYQLWATQRPAKSVGGDFYSYHLRTDKELLIAVGDVSDKGVPAALFMARAMTLLQVLADTELQPQQYLAQLNDDLAVGNENCMFVTMFCGILHLDTLRLRFASAGHTPPSLIRAGVCRTINQQSGPALALAEGLEYPDNTLQLRPADVLAIYTDGVDEAFNDQGEQFGIEAFNHFLAQSSHTDLADLGSAAYNAIDDHAGTTPQSDDITLMLLALPVPALARSDDTKSFSKTEGEAVCSSFLLWLRSRLAQHPQLEQNATELIMVAEEVFTNILKYGEMPAGGEIEVSLRVTESASELCFSDPCQAFDPLSDALRSALGLDSESAAIGGLGVHLLTALTDHQEYQRLDDRNILRLRKSHSPEQHEEQV